jgi:hypothetical protein
MMLQIFMPSLNVAELTTTNSLERYLIIFRTGEVSINCRYSFFVLTFSQIKLFLFLDFLEELSVVTLLDRMIQGSGLSGPIPSGISLLTNLTDLYV